MKQNNVEHEMLSLVIRYMVCAIFAMLSTDLVAIIGIIRGTDPNNLIWRGIHIWFHIADETINLFCLYLQFPFGWRAYKKCCGGIDRCFKSCLVKCLGLNVRNDYEKKELSSKSKTSVKTPATSMDDATAASTNVTDTEMSI